MKTMFSSQAPKKATNLSLNSELLAEAKRLNINLSATMEKALEIQVLPGDIWNSGKINRSGSYSLINGSYD